MRILYVSSSTVPSRSANSVHVMKMCQALAAHGHEVRLLTMKRPDHEIEISADDAWSHYGVQRTFEIQPLPFPSLPGRPLVYSLACWKDARSWSPDLIYGRYFPAIALLGRLGMRIAYESHERIWDRSARARKMAKALFARPGFARLVVISEALKRMYLEEALIPEELITVAHDAADPVDVEMNRSPGGTFRAGYVGGVYPGRGIEMLVECARSLDHVEFHFVGAVKEDLSGLCGAESIPPNVICHGYRPPEQIPELRADFNVLLAPYQTKVAIWGGSGDTSSFMSPLKIFEYMASGKPIICSDLPVLREVLNQANSVLVPPAETEAWIAAISALRTSPSRAIQLARQAQEDFLAHYTWSERAARIIQACQA